MFLERLLELEVYHARTTGYPSIEPVVVIVWQDRSVVIEGNTRVNKWRCSGSTGPFPAIVVTPRTPPLT